MDSNDKSWMNCLIWSDEFQHGVKDFLEKAFKRASQGNEILCPCRDCKNYYWHYRDVVEDHLFSRGFRAGYTKWTFHGENASSRKTYHPINDDEGSNMRDDIDGLLHDIFRNVEVKLGHEEGDREGLPEDAKRFFKLLEDGKQQLYLGCENLTKLSFTIRLFLFKSLHGLINVAFSDLFVLIKKAFPFAQIPGLDYEKIHGCPNDCMLFRKDNEKAENCSVCGTSRWKSVDGFSTNARSKIPAKVLRYFPLKPRLQRMFMCPETTVAMKWHANERPNNGNLRHPVDGQAWKDFDRLYPDFSRDPRNVRLGLSSDGFNPFRTMSISHSTWPVMLMKYNLSPWICMKIEYQFQRDILHISSMDIDFIQKLEMPPRKNQNSGVTLSTITDSFASARDQNPIDEDVVYYGFIQDILEIDYYGCFNVLLFRCDWYQNEVDEYGLTWVYFNKLCCKDDLFVLASQVYQVFYIADTIDKDVYYARNKVSVDLYDLEEENFPNIGETFSREPNDDIGPSTRLDEGDFRWSREYGAIVVVDIPSTEEHSEAIVVETSEEEDEFDNTDWDRMEADD